MSLKNTIDSYGLISKSFHWIMAFIIIANFILGFFLDDIPVGPYKLLAFGIHKSTGILVLGAIILRIVWKGFNQTPMILSSNRAFVILAKSLHHLFYLMFFVIPVSGWAYSSAAGRAVNFYGLFTLPDLVEKNQLGYKAFREDYFKKENPTTPYSFVLSRGIAIKNEIDGQRESNHVEGILATQEEIKEIQGLITLNTTETISHNGELLKFPKGVPIIKNSDVLEFLNNRKFNNKEANSIFYVIKSIADDIISQSKKGNEVTINKKLSRFLDSIFYWKSKSDTKTPNQIGIDTQSFYFNIGKNSYPLSQIEENKENILNDIKEAYLSVNNKGLTQNFNEPFTEYVADNTGNITPIEWKNYQIYLLL